MFAWLRGSKFLNFIKNFGEKTGKSESGCTDYRTYIFCWLTWIDSGLVQRGLTWPLVFVMASTVGTECCSFLSIFGPAPLRVRMECFKSFLLGNLVTSVIFNEYANRRRLDRLHKYLGSAMSSLRTDLKEEKAILDRARNEAGSNLRMYIIIFGSNTALMTFVAPAAAWLAGRPWRKLPIPWTIPPSDTDLGFTLVFSFQIINIMIANCIGMVFMSFSSITIQMTALFDVLLLSLRHIEDRASTRCKREGFDYQTALVACLRDDLSFYNSIIRELASATPHLRNTFLAFSATVPMIMAGEAFQVLAGGDDLTFSDLIKSVAFLAIQFGCWAQTCIRLETMTDQHGAVFQALYETPWYESGVKFKKLVYTALIYSTQPKHIKARLSTEIRATTATFYSFAVSSFNWLNLIRKVD